MRGSRCGSEAFERESKKKIFEEIRKELAALRKEANEDRVEAAKLQGMLEAYKAHSQNMVDRAKVQIGTWMVLMTGGAVASSGLIKSLFQRKEEIQEQQPKEEIQPPKKD